MVGIIAKNKKIKNNKSLKVWGRISASDLSCDVQRSFPSMLSVHSELGRLIDDTAALLKPRPVSLDLQTQNKSHSPT